MGRAQAPGVVGGQSGSQAGTAPVICRFSGKHFSCVIADAAEVGETLPGSRAGVPMDLLPGVQTLPVHDRLTTRQVIGLLWAVTG